MREKRRQPLFLDLMFSNPPAVKATKPFGSKRTLAEALGSDLARAVPAAGVGAAPA